MHPGDLQGRASRIQPRIATALALATVAFGASTVYLARSLHAERGQQETTSEPVVATPPVAPSAAQDPHPSNAPEMPQALLQDPSAPPPVAPEPPVNAVGPTRQARLQQTIDELSDPFTRTQRIADIREGLVGSAGPMIDAIGLQPHEMEAALDFIAESNVDHELHVAQCQMRPDCDLKADERSRASAEMDRLERAIGPEGSRRVLAFEARRRVLDFARSLPPAHALSDDGVERLVEAFMEGRRRWAHTDDPLDVLNGQLRQQAAAVLSEDQLAAFVSGQRRYFEF